MSEKYKLKPCPFCGDTGPEFERKGTSRASMIVACTTCGGRMESGDVHGLTSNDNLSWNERPIESGIERRLAEAKRMEKFNLELCDKWRAVARKLADGLKQIMGPNVRLEMLDEFNALINKFMTHPPTIKRFIDLLEIFKHKPDEVWIAPSINITVGDLRLLVKHLQTTTTAQYNEGFNAGYNHGFKLGEKTQSGWQPISTAPTDGRRIIAWVGGAVSPYPVFTAASAVMDRSVFTHWRPRSSRQRFQKPKARPSPWQASNLSRKTR